MVAGAKRTADAVVIGGGLHGMCSAIHLARAGLRVVVLEKDRVGRHASGSNAGGVRRLGRALPEIPLAVAALERWHAIEDLVDDRCGFEVSAQIKVAETEAELDALRQRSKTVRDAGFSHEVIIDRALLRQLLPAAGDHCVGAMMVDGDGHADPFSTVRAFHRKAVSLGVEFAENAAVTDIKRLSENWLVQTGTGTVETPVVVNAAGAWGARIAAMLGEDIPIEAQALMLMITERVRPFLSAVVGAQGRTLSFKQFDNGTVLIGGGYQGSADVQTGRTRVEMRGLAANAVSAAAVFPLMRNVRVTRGWAAIEGVMPDRIPVIGPGQQPGVFHLFGFSAHGFALAPIGGQIVADLVMEGRANLPIAAFDSQRF